MQRMAGSINRLAVCKLTVVVGAVWLLVTSVSVEAGGVARVTQGAVTFGEETVDGSVSASGGASLTGTHFNGNLNAGGGIRLTGATVLGNINAGGLADLKHTRLTGHLNAAGSARLLNTTILGNVSVAGTPTIERSVIDGTLATPSHQLILSASKVRNIRLTEPVSGNLYTRPSAIYGNAVSIGPGTMVNANGFKISADRSQTTVIVPGGTIYVNGRKVHGMGPNHFAAYRRENPGAPTVRGPGWDDSAAAVPQVSSGPATQILRLTRNSEVFGKVVFDGGAGKVVVEKGSRFDGVVEGGTVERL